MNKYNLEGGIDFYSELYKSLDIDECNEKNANDENMCLITNLPLTDKYVSLNCGHKFNYIPLYNDIVNHKKKFNYLEGTYSKLNANEIRCPYCRKKQEGLLNYYEDLGLAKIHGVNFYSPTLKQKSYSMNTGHNCNYKYLNPSYNISKPESSDNNKYLLCSNYFASQISLYNSKEPLQPITFGDTNYYCYLHKKQMIKEYKIIKKEKEKQEKYNAKQLEKTIKLLEKINAKAKVKEEKQKVKEEKQKVKEENIVLGPSMVENEIKNIGCIKILKSGVNKGKPCCKKIYLEYLCKRHFEKDIEKNIEN